MTIARAARAGARTFQLSVAAVLLSSVTLAAAPQTSDGEAIFARNCASCHDGAAGSRAPSPDVLKRRSPEAILSALTAGGMRPQGGRLSGAERRAVAEYLSGRALGGDITGARIGRCTSPAPLSDPASSPAWIGWSPSITNTRFQSAQQAGLTADRVPKLSLKWAFGFPDATSAWSQPTVAGGRVFVGSQNGTVYSLDAASGCIHWTFTAKSGVRTALSFGSREGTSTHSTRQRDANSGRAGSTSIRTRESPDRPRCTGIAFSSPSPRWRKPPQARLAMNAAHSAGA